MLRKGACEEVGLGATVNKSRLKDQLVTVSAAAAVKKTTTC